MTTSPASQPQAPTDWRALALQYKAPPDGWMTTNDHTLSKLGALAARPATAAEGVPTPLTDAQLLDLAEDFKTQYQHGGNTYDEFDHLGYGKAVLATLAAHLAQTATQPASEAEGDRYRKALVRIERAVDLHLGRSSWTQTKHLKGFGYSQEVRSELFAAHDEVRATLAQPAPAPGAGKGRPPLTMSMFANLEDFKAAVRKQEKP